MSTVGSGAGTGSTSRSSVAVDDFAFVRNAVTVDRDSTGAASRGETSRWCCSGRGAVGARPVRLDSDDDRNTVSFTFTPEQTGAFVYTVAAPVFPGEAVAENNSPLVRAEVIRDRVRVLLVVGRPSWDERFLRGVLKQDPNVDLVSFYILRTSADDTQTRTRSGSCRSSRSRWRRSSAPSSTPSTWWCS